MGKHAIYCGLCSRPKFQRSIVLADGTWGVSGVYECVHCDGTRCCIDLAMFDGNLFVLAADGWYEVPIGPDQP